MNEIFLFFKDEWQLLANKEQRRARKTVLKFGDFEEHAPKRRRNRDHSSSDESHFRKKEAKKVSNCLFDV